MDDNAVEIKEDTDSLVTVISCLSKRLGTLTVSRCNRWGHFDINVSHSTKPRALEGTFTSSREAVRVAVSYLENQPKTNGVKRKEIRDGRVNVSND